MTIVGRAQANIVFDCWFWLEMLWLILFELLLGVSIEWENELDHSWWYSERGTRARIKCFVTDWFSTMLFVAVIRFFLEFLLPTAKNDNFGRYRIHFSRIRFIAPYTTSSIWHKIIKISRAHRFQCLPILVLFLESIKLYLLSQSWVLSFQNFSQSFRARVSVLEFS